MEKPVRKPRILVAPLDWGLGHTTRCIPIIRELLARDVDVWLAGESPQKELLQQEFPDLPFLPLEGYRVKYARTGIGMLLSIFRQTQKIIYAIKKENEWLKKMVAEHEFDAVISDNRYGLHHADIPCIFITHQLTIKSPLGKWTEKVLQKKNYRYINRFTECWVPDAEGDNNLAGILSHPQKKPAVPVCYIGSLSRFRITNEPVKNNHLLVIVSGPEPQRSIFENKIIQEIAHYPSTATVVRGLPGSDSLIPSTGMIKFYNHLPAGELNKEMEQAEYIISRSGYSTVMDLVKLKKKSILIPTPGQTEQEYLAGYLSQKQIAFCVHQKDFLLTTSIKNASQFSYQLPCLDSGQLLEVTISKLLSSLNHG
jgi:uncharacterized protein (TIGR00661 family)